MKCCWFQSFSLAGRICSRGFTILTHFDFATFLYTVWSHEVAVSCLHYYWFSCGFCSWPAGFDLWCDWAFSLISFQTYSVFFLLRLNNSLIEVLGSYAGVFRGARLFFPHHKRLLNREQHSFPKLSQSHCTFQTVETWPWPLGYPIITQSAWNTGKALWPLLNVRLTIAKVILGQIL